MAGIVAALPFTVGLLVLPEPRRSAGCVLKLYRFGRTPALLFRRRCMGDPWIVPPPPLAPALPGYGHHNPPGRRAP